MRALVVVACISGLPVSAVGQGDTGFLRGKGNMDLAISFSLDTYDEFWIGNDRIHDPPFGRVDRYALNLYGAYGLTDDIDLVANASYVAVTTEHIFDDESDPQDLNAAIKWRFFSERLGEGTFNVLAFPSVKVPMSNYEDDNVNAIGDGQVDLRGHIILQQEFDCGAFLALDTGYDVRFQDPPDQFPINFSAGMTFDDFTVTAFYTLIDSLGGYDIGEGPFPGVEEDYDRLGLNFYLRITDHFGLTLAGWTTLDGKNTGDVDGFAVGTVIRL